MNPKIKITVDAKNKAIAAFEGMATVGAKIDVEIVGLPGGIENWGANDDFVGKSVRFRIVDELGNDLVRFPIVKKTTATDGDQWQVVPAAGTTPETYKTYNGTTSAQVDFDTDKLRKVFCGVAFNDKLEFGVIIDSYVDKAEFAVGKMKIQQWAHASTDTPTVLPDWREIKAGLDNATARVTKVGDTATISITDTHGTTTTATVTDGTQGAPGAPGATGPTGAKIVSQVKTGEDASGGYIYTQTFDDGTTATFTAPKGANGPANTLTIGTVQSGTTASATITGTSPNQTLNLVLPRGDKGDAGNAATVGVHSTVTGAAGTDANVDNMGTSSAASFKFTIPRGAKGDTGDAGPANTLAIGTVQSGTTASATITGTSPNQTLNLVLPKGDKGDDGEEGPQGDGSYIYDPADQKWHNVTVYTDPVTGEKTTNVSPNGTSVRPSVDSPIATVTQTATGATITTTDATHGTKTATVTNGTDGEDGHSPVLTQSKSGKTTTIYKDGVEFATIQDGVDGTGSVSGAKMNGNTVALDTNGVLQIGTVLTDATAFASATHAHAASDITSGTFEDARIASAATWNAKGTYSKPNGGIPSSDLASDVQTALTNARTPTAHASTHATNGDDAITPSSIGAIANIDTATCAGIQVVASDPGTYTENVIYFIKASA